ncbi:MAG TPA: SDR family NAD(P)-dependent oxidoreductase [Oligoflexus sp.]|uniref:SDR family NAD(P)-dependent oxidoreductase n=1 Tax=Oligoflexus sp. TaxID=1971216 RepID=UPI002D7F8332|nr:SDR family NAD(P)-dependent oxidoreductase [Oligoflexus sp.]HET9238947.1 SDR family NAD(P)-dependent oxidoreductase [Oligoflexus sp.]
MVESPNDPVVAIFGASSGMAFSVARIYAQKHARLFLIARDKQKLNDIERDLKARGASEVQSLVADLGSAFGARAATELLRQRTTHVDVVIIASGILGDTEQLLSDPKACEDLFNVNVQAPIAISNSILPLLLQQKSGVLAIFSSVAGDRGRASNFVYGASKAALTAYASGLRARLSESGVQVLTIKPGIVATAMTAHLPRGPLTANPEAVAKRIVQAIEKRKDTLYAPGFWRWVMAVITHLPEFIFKRLRF